MTSSTTCLIDEISGQFLTCEICCETFKRPKTLKCQHTFCEECLEIRYAIEEQERPYRFLLSRSLSCPLCLTKTELPLGGVRRLPDNSVVTQLDDVIRRRKSSLDARSCDICSGGGVYGAPRGSSGTSRGSGVPGSQASAKCVECSKMMCRKCVDLHKRTKVTREHCIFDIEADRASVECKSHGDEEVRFYCDQCQTCICIVCTFHDHSGHTIFTLTDAIDRYSGHIRLLLDTGRQRAAALRSQVDSIARYESSVKMVEESVREAAFELIAGVRRRERELVAQLNAIYSPDAVKLVGQRKDSLAETMRSLNGTCDLGDALLGQRSVEFLLVHREIAEKLNTILQHPLKDLPKEVVRMKNVRFTAGAKRSFDASVGYLHVSTPIEAVEKDIIQLEPELGIPRAMDTVGCTNSSVAKDAKTLTLNLDLRCDILSENGVESNGGPTSSTVPEPPKNVESSSSSESEELVPRSTRVQPPSALRPPSPRGPDVWVPPKQRRKPPTQLWEPSTAPLTTDTKCTTTATIYTMDRSTMTSVHTTIDRTTSTDWLIVSRDQETFTSPPLLFNSSVQTEPPKRGSKSVQFGPETLNKLTMTKRPILVERETSTEVVSKFDCEVSARVLGDDKSTSTRVTVTVSTGVGTDDDFDPRTFPRSLDPERNGNDNPINIGLSISDQFGDSRLSTPSTEYSLGSHDRESSSTLEPRENKIGTEDSGLTRTDQGRTDQLTSYLSRPSSLSRLSSSAYSSQRVSPVSNSMFEEHRCFGGTRECYCLVEGHLEDDLLSESNDLEVSENLEILDSVEGGILISPEKFTDDLPKQTNDFDKILPRSEEKFNEPEQVCTYRTLVSESLPSEVAEIPAEVEVLPSASVSADESEEDDLQSAGFETNYVEEEDDDENGDENQSLVDSLAQQVKCEDLPAEMVKLETECDDSEASETSCATEEMLEAAKADLVDFDHLTDSNLDPYILGLEPADSSNISDIKESSPTMNFTDDLETSLASDPVTDTLNSEFYARNSSETTEASDPLILNPDVTELLQSLVTESDTGNHSPEISEEEDTKIQIEQHNINFIHNNNIIRPMLMPAVDGFLSEKVKRSAKLLTKSIIPYFVASLSKTLTQLEQLLPEISKFAMSFKALPGSSGLVTLLMNIYTLVSKAGAKNRALSEAFGIEKLAPNAFCLLEEPQPAFKDRCPPILTDRASSPIRIPTRDAEVSTKTSLVNRGTSPDAAPQADIGVQTKRTLVVDKETSMTKIVLLDKEVSTPHVHLLHKNTATDNQTVADKSTAMATDVTAAYTEASARPVARFTRGTSTPIRPTPVDRASSPVRFSCVDKAVMAIKGEALEPMDTFPGKSKGGRRPFIVSNSRKAKLECISEGTIDEESEDSEVDRASVSSSFNNFRIKFVQKSVSVVREIPKSFARRNKIENPVLHRPRRLFADAFSFEGHGGRDEAEVLSEETEEDDEQIL